MLRTDAWARTALAPLLAMASTAAVAHIPAMPVPEKGWNGPGYLCEHNFTLRVEQDEYIREDPQLELSSPTSNTIKIGKGLVFYIHSQIEAASYKGGGVLKTKIGKDIQNKYDGFIVLSGHLCICSAESQGTLGANRIFCCEPRRTYFV